MPNPITDHSPIPPINPVSRAADAFLRNLKTYEEAHIRECLDEGVREEIKFWIAHNLENEERDEVKFEHGEIDVDFIAERVNAHIVGWNATDVMEYGMGDTADEDDDDIIGFEDE